MLKPLFAAVTFALLTSAAHAGTILHDSGSGQLQVDFFEPVGQSFTAIDSQLLSIGFRFGEINPGNSNDPIQLDLYAGTGTGGPLIATRTLTLPVTVDYSFFTDFDFTGTSLTIGSVYSAALSVNGSSPLTGVVFGAGGYAGGTLFSPQAGILGCPADGCDLSFRVVGERGSVPEPASLALMLGGLALLGGSMHRRRRAAHG